MQEIEELITRMEEETAVYYDTDYAQNVSALIAAYREIQNQNSDMIIELGCREIGPPQVLEEIRRQSAVVEAAKTWRQSLCPEMSLENSLDRHVLVNAVDALEKEKPR